MRSYKKIIQKKKKKREILPNQNQLFIMRIKKCFSVFAVISRRLYTLESIQAYKKYDKMNFRKTFEVANKMALRWFPGHMGKGLRQMEQKLKSVDCIIEVHDARVPYTGRNPEFQHSIIGQGIKPHILVLNKKDLLDVREQRILAQEVREQEGKHVIFTNCKDQQCRGIKSIMPITNELITSSDRYNREGLKDICVMIIGVPNVGKSSLLNVLRNRHLHKKAASRVGAIAGVTRSVMERIKISENPLIYMIDTPGILEPKINDLEAGMKLALVGCLPDHHVGEDYIADYLLYWLNRQGRFDYVNLLGLKEPTDNISEALVTYANKLDVKKRIKRVDGLTVMMPDILTASRKFIEIFRKGQLGGLNLDKPFKY